MERFNTHKMKEELERYGTSWSCTQVGRNFTVVVNRVSITLPTREQVKNLYNIVHHNAIAYDTLHRHALLALPTPEM